MSYWLDGLNALGETRPFETKSKPSGNEVFYVFRHSFDHRAGIVPVKAYVKKDGSIGKNVQEYSGHHSLSHAPAGTSLEDAVIFAQLEYLSAHTYIAPVSSSFITRAASSFWLSPRAFRAFEIAWPKVTLSADMNGPSLLLPVNPLVRGFANCYA